MRSKKFFLPVLLMGIIVPCISLWAQATKTNIQEVISRMYDNWLSLYSTPATFKPDNNIRRDEAAKFITIFAYAMLNQQWKESPECYTFNDINKVNSLQTYIIQSCELWYMKWANNKFDPTGNLTNEQAIAIIIRANDWRLEEPKSDRSKNYYARAKELGIIDGLDLSNKTAAITRGNFAILVFNTSQAGTKQIKRVGTIATSFIDMLGIKINSNTGITDEFIGQASTCLSWANTITETDFDMMGMSFYIKSYRQIRWFDWNKCKIYERAEAANINISTGMIANAINSGATQSEINEEIAMMQSDIQKTIGKDGICTYDTWTLVMNLQKESSGKSLPMGNLGNDTDNCTWALYENNL